MGWISMGSISKMVYYVINYHCAKFGVFTINSTIISPFCWTIWFKVTRPSYFFYHFRINYGLNLETLNFSRWIFAILVKPCSTQGTNTHYI